MLTAADDHRCAHNEVVPRPTVLHVTLAIDETSAPYNDHCLPMAGERELALCTCFPPIVTVPRELPLFAGDGSFRRFAAALRAALEFRTPDVIHVHNPHIGLLLVLLKAMRRLPPTVLTVHNSHGCFAWRHRLMLLPAFASLDRIVCCGEASLASFPAAYRWLSGGRLRAIPNGVNIRNIDRVPPRPREAGREPTFTIVVVARLVEVKNHRVALEAFRAMAGERCRLVLLGDGPLRGMLSRHIAECGLGTAVELAGTVSRDEVYATLKSADLFLSTSRGEGLPVSVLEAMACGCPVVLSDIPPHREIAAGKDFVPLVRPEDVEGFTRELRRFRGMPAETRTSLGERCRELVASRYSLEAMHAKYGILYAELAAETVATQ